jgi:hypothetical protein
MKKFHGKREKKMMGLEKISEFMEGGRRAVLLHDNGIRVIFYENGDVIHSAHVLDMSEAEHLAEDFVQGRHDPKILFS